MDKYLQSLKILREKFIEENDELLEKIKESEKTGEFKVTSLGQLNQFYMRDFLEVFSLPNFYFLELLQLYEELLYLYHFFDCENVAINIKDFFKDGVFQKESFLKSANSAIEIIIAKKDIESHVKKLAEEIGIFNLDTSQQADNFVSLKQYLTAIEKAKNKKLYHSGDEEFLVSKIPINGKGFIENNLKIDNRVFYTSKSEHIIAMARVSRPGIYLIANIPYEKYANAGFYILFVTEGDCYLVDNNIHAFRSFLSRSEDRLMERRTDGTFLPWEIISDFIEKRSEDKTLTDTISDFSFRVIGNLSTVNHTDIFGLTALIDTCLYTFTKTNFLKESSVALKASMIDINFLSKPENMPLTVYKQNVPSISSLDLTWKPEKFELPEKTSGDYLVPFLEKLPIEKINLDLTRDELTSLKQIERNLSFQLRKQSAKILEEKLKNDHKRNWEKVRERLRIFIQKRFAENPIHYFMKILEDREYSYEAYKGFGTRDEEKFKSEETMTEKEKILSIYCDHETIHGTHHNVYYAMSDRNFHFVEFSGCRNRYFPCASCRKNGKLEYVLTIRDVQQFIKFFELTEEEIKHLPKQMMNYLNQARCHYNGNHILEDLDPVSLINNPWWVSSNGRDDPQITLSLALCKFCKKRYEK